MEEKVNIPQYEQKYLCKSEDVQICKEKMEKNIKIDEKSNGDLIDSVNIVPKKQQQNAKIIRIIIFLVIFLIIMIVIFVEVNKSKHKKDSNDKSSDIILPAHETELIKIEKEFDIKTKLEDLRHISVLQKTREENIISNIKIANNIIRKTNYDIYFLNEEEAEDSNKLYYSKIYSGIISIESECTSEEDDCYPQPLIELTKDINLLRNLDNSEIFKDKPLALCLFNITDNNVITTFSCPESLSDAKRNEIILDLYFFRPPATQRADKKNDNITLTITKEEGTNNKLIREINGGSCNIYNNGGSECTTEMNTTLDEDGNLLTYDEQAITIINYDEHNTYVKNKITHLSDNSENIKDKDKEKEKNNYIKSLNSLLPLLKPYMKEEVQFTEKDYEDLLNVIKDKMKSKDQQNYTPKKIKNTFRNLAIAKIANIKQTDLFLNRGTPTQVNLRSIINTGLNSEKMGAYGSIIFDEQEFKYSSIEENSELNSLLEKLIRLSKAGNTLAAELYEKIYDKFETVVNELSIKFNSLDAHIKSFDIIKIFNSTLIKYQNNLPSDIEQLSNELLSKLSGIYTNIESGDIKSNKDILKKNLDSFFEDLYEIKGNMLGYLTNLSHLLFEKNNTYALILNYYTNDTSISYINTVKEVKSIIDIYIENEYNKSVQKIEELLIKLEQNSNDTLTNVLASLKKLINDLKEDKFSIGDDKYQLILSNLENSLQYPSDIIQKIKEYLSEIKNIYKNGNIISKENINNINKSFNFLISESEKVNKKLNNIDIIDTVFDEIMIKFRESYANTVKYMEEIKSGNFTLEDDVLNENLFTSEVKSKLENELKSLSDNILDNIKKENNIYMSKIKKYLDKIYEENYDELNKIIIELSILFSDEAIQDVEKSFENSLNLYLEKLSNLINVNINFAEEYINQYYNMLNDENSLKNWIENNYSNSNQASQSFQDSSTLRQSPTFDLIYGNKITSTYFNKYNTFIANLNYTEEYLTNQIQVEIINEYREIFIKIKEEFQSILNNKLADKFQDYEQVNFFENHEKIINRLILRFDKYFSDEIFDNKYTKIINQNINNNKNLIKSAKKNMNEKHNYIKLFPIEEDNINDMCIIFRRKVCYGCTNCVAYTFFPNNFCFILSPYEYNHLKIEKIYYEQIKNFGNLNDEFTKLDNIISSKINKYNDIFKDLDSSISLLKQETLNENITFNYLSPLNDWIDSIIKQKLGNVILNYAYEYHQKNIETKLEIMFKDVFNKWQIIFGTLGKEINYYAEQIKYSNFEFSNMAMNYLTILQTDHLENYYNSINLFERAEFNYTISYYYNYFMNLINKSYKYITQKITENKNNFNDIIIERKNEIRNIFDNFTTKISDSEYESLSMNNQLNTLKANETDFFKVKYILNKNKNETNVKLEDLIEDIRDNEFYLIPGDKYSLYMKYCLENNELAKTINKYYDSFDKGNYLNLNLNKFKDVMLENWVFDGYDFTNILNNALYETNNEIINELFIKKEEYSTSIENEINKFYDNNLENIINNQFTNYFKELPSNLNNNIIRTVSSLLNNITNLIQLEASKINNSPGIYSLNNELIKSSYDNIKNIINENINMSIFYILDEFYEKIYNDIYFNCIENKLGEFMIQTKNIAASNEFGEYILLNSSFNIGEIISNLTRDVLNNYKKVIEKKINLKYLEYYEKIKTSINITNLDNIVDNYLEDLYRNEFLPVLNKKNNCSSNQCIIYNFMNNSQNNINDKINQAVNEIKNKMLVIKNDNYKFNFQCKLDFSNSGKNVLKPICESLKQFFSFEKEEQISRINELIQNEIKFNLEDFLNNVIPSFGNIFFQRIIDYNINFKIVDLYQNLHYALGQTFLYYQSLEITSDIKDLPIELKHILYNFNNLDSTIIEKAQKIKSLSNEELIILINNLKNIAKEKYSQFLKEDETIKNNFSPEILEKINLNLAEIMPEIEKNYQTMLEKYLKEKFIKEFSETLDQRSNEIIQLFYAEKTNLTQRLDQLFSNTKDEELNAINKYINKTLSSIDEYKNYLSNFEISENSKNYFIDYSKNIILPILEKFKKDFSVKIKDSIINEINTNSKEIENLSFEPFEIQVNDIYSNFISGYIGTIQKDILQYCDKEKGYNNSYYKNLEIEIAKNEEYYRRRRLFEPDSEDIFADEAKQRIESKYVEETLEQLVNKTRNVQKYLDNINTFVNYERIIKNYQNNLNIDYKNIKEMIAKNQYIDEIDEYLKQKLTQMTYVLSNYYKNINSTIYFLKIDLLDSIKNILNSLDFCTDITSYILNNEYQKISDSTERINKTRKNHIENYSDIIKYKHQAENMMNEAKAYIKNLNEYSEFYLDLTLEGNKFKIPKVKARILNKIIPQDVQVIITSANGFCHENYYKFTIGLNDANYTMSLEYDTKSNYINITTFSNIDSYQYKLQIAEKIGQLETISVGSVNLRVSNCVNPRTRIYSESDFEVSNKSIKESMILFN